MLRSFSCVKNESIESFLHSKAILQEVEDRARTTLIVDDDTGDIVGYYTLKIESFMFTDASGKNRKRLAGNKDATNFNCILIAKIGRSDKYKGKVSGDEILNAALYSCSRIKFMTATKIVCVEYIDEPRLMEFYERNGFIYFQRNGNGLNISFIKI
ncbi:hypothetical protein FZC66_19400 [Priestia megaterium]|nr:hypothetical protein FZC66_19400 [Priestia megaterium]